MTTLTLIIRPHVSYSKLDRTTGRQLRLVGEAKPGAGGSLPGKLQHLRHHGPDPVMDVVERRLTHEGWGRDHLVFLVHVSFVHSS